MVQDSHGSHHFHKRKRIHQKHETYPHPDKFKRFIDKLILVVCVAAPVMTIPQVVKIWFEQNAMDVSALSWGSYLVFATIWLIYGVVHKEKPLIITNSLWIVLDILIVVGTIIYG